MTDPEDLIEAINTEMAKGETRRSGMSASEEALIKLNAELSGFQDRLDPAGNIRLSKSIRYIMEDMNRSVCNIIIVPYGRIESQSGQKSNGNGARRILARKYGVNTIVINYDSTVDGEALKAMQLAIDKAGKIKDKNKFDYPKIFGNFDYSEHNDKIHPYLNGLSEDLRNMIVVNAEDIKKDSTIDEVKMIVVGSAILNDHRLSHDFGLPPEDLKEGRKKMIDAFVAAKIISLEPGEETETAEGLDKIMKRIYSGRALTINPINWQELRDFQDSMELVLKSV
jgi:hypothetical protein